MLRKLAISSVILLFGAGPAPGEFDKFLPDKCDDDKIVWGVHEQKDVVQFRQKLDEFRKDLLRLKERDFVALFGAPRAKPAITYAMPICQRRSGFLVRFVLRRPEAKQGSY